MKSVRFPLVKTPSKAPTGVAGFDEITGGGLPRGRTTRLLGEPGSGSLQHLALRFTQTLIAQMVQTEHATGTIRWNSSYAAGCY